MSQFLTENVKDFPVGRMGQFACAAIEDGEPMISLVKSAFFLALILLIPAVIEAVLRENRSLVAGPRRT